jgi:hypothetical protein
MEEHARKTGNSAGARRLVHGLLLTNRFSGVRASVWRQELSTEPGIHMALASA